ncbi:trihydrophobin-like [Sorghum bicolor]|uniref:trihydrophobin-like n=1 Tax=Sorghum bicolor TaxID=4558 RepID=UPI000B423EB9|nr:trihydrophobin-like [Sorghum bicolor]|eukprot:XP_021314573.1 trihydrophobin-like [Sorghum bicolor]
MGVGEEFESVTSAVANRTDPISLLELQAQLVSHEQRREIRDGGSHSSVNSAEKGGRRGGRPSYSCGGRGGGGRGGFGRGRNSGRNGGRGGGHNNNNNFTNNTFLEGVICQICGREGHGADRCYKYVGYPPKKSASAATTSYGVDTNWYMDTGATDHITSELDQLTIRDRYNGNDHVHTASGSGNEENPTPRQM